MPDTPPAASFRLSEETHAHLWWLARQMDSSKRGAIAELARAEVVRRGGNSAAIIAAYRAYKAHKQHEG